MSAVVDAAEAALSPVKRYVELALVAALAFGSIWAYEWVYDRGYAAREQIAQNEKAAAVAAALTGYAANVADARSRDASTISTLQAQAQRAARVQGDLEAHLAAQAALPLPTDANTPPLLAQCVVDDDTVRMLNDARGAAAAPDGGASRGGDAPLRAAAPAQAASSGDGSQRAGHGR